MAELNITQGTRVQIGFAPEIGTAPEYNMSATFFKALDDVTFLLSIPLKDGKPVVISETQKLLLKYEFRSEPMIFSAYCDDVVKQGIRSYWKLRKVTEPYQIFRRKDERYKVALKMNYHHPSWLPDKNGAVEEEEGISLDVSAGGAALFLNNRFDVGDVCVMTLPRVSQEPEGAPISGVVAAICWYRDAPPGSVCRFVAGVQFRFEDDVERNRLRAYIDHVKKVYKL